MKIKTIKDPRFISAVLADVGVIVRDMLVGGSVEIRVQRESKSRIQEEKYNAMITDISNTVLFDGARHKFDVWKAWLVDAFEQELLSMGERLSYPSRQIFSMDKMRIISIRATTTEFRKKEASDFIEFLYKTGTEYGAKFTDKSLKAYDEIIQSRGIK